MKTSAHSSVSACKGITLLELMVTIAVAAILLTLAVPSLEEFVRRNEIAGQNNELIAMIHLARNEAIRRNPLQDPVTVELTPGTNAWQGAVLAPGEDGEEDCPDDAIRCTDQRNVTLSFDSGSSPLRFDNRGYSVNSTGDPIGVTLSLVHRNCQTDRHARTIQVFPGGQVASRPLDCPGG